MYVRPCPRAHLLHHPQRPTDFSATCTLPDQFNATGPFLFTGKMVSKEAFDTYGSLTPVKRVGEILAAGVSGASYITLRN